MKKLFLLFILVFSYAIGIAQNNIEQNTINQKVLVQDTLGRNAVNQNNNDKIVPDQNVVTPNPTDQKAVDSKLEMPQNVIEQNSVTPNAAGQIPVGGYQKAVDQNAPVQNNIYPNSPGQNPAGQNPPVYQNPAYQNQGQNPFYQNPIGQNPPGQRGFYRNPAGQNAFGQNGIYQNPDYQNNGGAIIGNSVVVFTFVASPQITWLASGSKEVSSNQSRLGFNFGVEGDIFINNERYSLLTGLTISSLGGTLTYKVPFTFSDSSDDLPAGTKVEYFLRYVEIPFAIKMRSKEFNRARFFAQFGLNNWLNIKAKASTSDNTFDKDIVNEEIRFFAFGLNIGGGVEYDLGNNNSLTGGIIYTGSFNDVTSNPSVDDKTTINSLRFRLGFIF